jgi:hypothetical protein
MPHKRMSPCNPSAPIQHIFIQFGAQTLTMAWHVLQSEFPEHGAKIPPNRICTEDRDARVRSHSGGYDKSVESQPTFRSNTLHLEQEPGVGQGQSLVLRLCASPGGGPCFCFLSLCMQLQLRRSLPQKELCEEHSAANLALSHINTNTMSIVLAMNYCTCPY